MPSRSLRVQHIVLSVHLRPTMRMVQQHRHFLVHAEDVIKLSVHRVESNVSMRCVAAFHRHMPTGPELRDLLRHGWVRLVHEHIPMLQLDKRIGCVGLQRQRRLCDKRGSVLQHAEHVRLMYQLRRCGMWVVRINGHVLSGNDTRTFDKRIV